MKHIAITFACLVFAGTALAGPVYQGVDEDGRTYFSDRPLHAETERVVQVRFAKAATPAPKAADAMDGETDADESVAAKVDIVAEKNKEREFSKNEIARYAENCAMAKTALGEIESQPRLYQMLEDGSRRYYSARERGTMLKNAKADVARWCNPS